LPYPLNRKINTINSIYQSPVIQAGDFYFK
jgi:hypothetical protein